MVKYSEMWKIGEIPFYILVGWSLISVLLQAFVLGTNKYIGWAGYLMMVIAFSYLASIILKSGHGIAEAAKTGAFIGALSGLAGAIIAILSFYAFPGLFQAQIEQAVAMGSPRDTIEKFMLIGLFVSLVISPIISALFGAGLSALSALVIKSTMAKK